MNKSRALVARTARALSSAGSTVVVPDLYGTGDSEGDFVDADWRTWLDDQCRLGLWARRQGAAEVVFWGLRSGCLLAAEAAATDPGGADRLILWQPVHSGKQQMTQFLRLRMAASLGQAGDARESVAELKEKLADAGSLRVAGYELGSRLLQDMDVRQIGEVRLPVSLPVDVLEVTSGAAALVNRVTQKQVAAWQEAGHPCRHRVVVGDPFWATQELGEAPELAAATVALFDGPAGPLPGGDHAFEGLISETSSHSRSVSFSCEGASLAGVVHRPPPPVARTEDVGVVIVVGGPQYRIGSHRQFLLMARTLAEAGWPVLRFDYRGMGDSAGPFRGFMHVEADIRAAVDALCRECPQVKRVVLWGLCDAATASVFYAHTDARVVGLVAANPWVYSEAGAARAYLKHYYWRRLLSRSFWSKLVSGRVSPRASLASIGEFLGKLLASPAKDQGGSKQEVHGRKEGSKEISATEHVTREHGAASSPPSVDLVKLFAVNFNRFSGRSLLLISGNDLTAAEFMDAARSSKSLRKQLAGPRVHQRQLPGVDHTFSRPEWRRQVEQETLHFLSSL